MLMARSAVSWCRAVSVEANQSSRTTPASIASRTGWVPQRRVGGGSLRAGRSPAAKAPARPRSAGSPRSPRRVRGDVPRPRPPVSELHPARGSPRGFRVGLACPTDGAPASSLLQLTGARSGPSAQGTNGGLWGRLASPLVPLVGRAFELRACVARADGLPADFGPPEERRGEPLRAAITQDPILTLRQRRQPASSPDLASPLSPEQGP